MRLAWVGLLLFALVAVSGCRSRDASARGPSTAPVARSGSVDAVSGSAPQPIPPETGAPAQKPPAPPQPRKEIVIAWGASLLYLLEDGKPIGKPLIINSSRAQYLRPAHLGDFEISEKIREWRSNLFDVHGDPLSDPSLAETEGAIMRNWMRLGELGVGLHYSPAFRFYTHPEDRHRSHGCYRMSKKDSNFVFAWAPRGTPIHVVRSLAGTPWAFLRAVTPPELLPGYKPKHKARRQRAADTAAAPTPSAGRRRGPRGRKVPAAGR